MLRILLASTIPMSALALLYARWEYRKRGRLTVLGLTLLCAMLLMPNLVVHFASSYRLPDTLLGYTGLAICVSGLVLCLAGIVPFRSPLKVLCLDPGELTMAGPYRWSRNPQYVGWVIFVAGYTLMEPSAWSVAALLVVALSLHLLVLIEEVHLLRTFGDAYAAYRRRVPRYLLR